MIAMVADSTRSAFVFVVPWTLEYVGGVNQVVINLAAEMIKAGSYSPIFFVDDWNAPNPVWEKFGSVPMVRWRIPPLTKGMGLPKRIRYYMWKLRFRDAFRRFCSDYRVAAINLHYPGTNAFSLIDVLDTGRNNVPLLVSFHGADLSSIERATASERERWQKLTHRLKAVVACSHDLSRRIRDSLGKPSGVSVIHNGVNKSSFAAVDLLEPPRKGHTLLTVGKFEIKKGQDILIEAFASLAPDYPDARLVLVGAKDLQLPHLQTQCEEAGLSDRVTFFTDVPHTQIADHFRRATIFVLPSRQEPFGIVLLEAGCFGLPVIASNVGGIPEIITDGLTGVLVSQDNPAELASALRSLLNDPTKAAAMGMALQRHVNQKFTWTQAHDQYVKLVRS